MSALSAVHIGPLKLNLGCGADLKRGYVNVDVYGKADVKHDLTAMPWPWADSTVMEVEMLHVLEHLPDTINTMKELYRVCADGAKVHIVVPHPRHDDYLSDPTHVSPITVKMMRLFSRRMCDKWQKGGYSDTPLAIIHGVDFEIIKEGLNIESRWEEKLHKGQITMEQLQEYCLIYSNVAKEVEVTMRVCK